MTEPVEYHLDPHATAFVARRDDVYRHLRDHCPVAHSGAHDGFYILSRYDDVRTALMDPVTFSSAPRGRLAIPPTRNVRDFPLVPQEIDPPRQTALKALVLDRFRRPAVAELEPTVRAAADRLVDGFVAQGRCEVVADYALPLYSYSLAAFLELPLGDADRWIAWTNAILANRVAAPDAGRRAMRQFQAYVEQLLDERREQPGTDFFSTVAHAQVDGRPITRDEAVGLGVQVLLAGRDAVVDAISTSLWYLAAHPAQQAALRRDPSVIPRAVEELLRLMSPIQLLGRTTTRDVQVAGATIPAGSVVAMTYGSANRDERFFEAPDECRFDRRRNQHLAFGAGPHVCLGAHLARLDVKVALEQVLTRFGDFALTPTAPAVEKTNGDTRGFQTLTLDLLAGPGR
jgi:cytochrome P450